MTYDYIVIRKWIWAHSTPIFSSLAIPSCRVQIHDYLFLITCMSFSLKITNYLFYPPLLPHHPSNPVISKYLRMGFTYDGPDSRREFSQSIAHLLSTHVLYIFSHHPIPNSLWIPFLPFPTFVFAINNYNNKNVQRQKRIFAWNICFHKLVIKTRCIWTDECLDRGFPHPMKFRIKRLLVRRCWSAREETHEVNAWHWNQLVIKHPTYTYTVSRIGFIETIEYRG